MSTRKTATICLVVLGLSIPTAFAELPHRDADIVQAFQEYCLDTELDIGAIIEIAEANSLPSISEKHLYDWSQGISPSQAAGFLLDDQPYTVLKLGLQGTITSMQHRMNSVGLASTSLSVSPDRLVPDPFNTMPDDTIGTKFCAVFRVGEGRLIVSDEISALSYAGTMLGNPKNVRPVTFKFPIGLVNAVVAGIYEHGPYVNFISGVDPADRQFVKLASSGLVAAEDSPETYQIALERR